MRIIDPAFQAHLDGGATTLCQCWRIIRRDGRTLGFTDHDRQVSFDGTLFEPETGADGAALSASADLAVDNTEIEGALSSDHLSTDDLAAGRYDGAMVEIWRVNWAAPGERLLLRKGVIGEVKREGARFTAEIRGCAHALGQQSGRVYQRQCDAVVGDGRCGVDLEDARYKASGLVSAVIDQGRFAASGLSGFDDAWFDHGALRWTSGANAGEAAFVKSHGMGANGAAIALWLPAGGALAPGDGFEITAGCDKRAATCAQKFSNIINFRGFHLMPGNDFAVSYPLRGERNDGGRR